MEDNENETDQQKRQKDRQDRSPSPAIKSTAVVKYTAFHSPVAYSRLQCNTDLNLPPSNWSAAIDSYGLKQILTRGTGLSSFRMAHMFPDSVGDVDVISGAECIKKLLKLPYQPNGTVSMMVHRVENTLLLDDFDVYDYLMKSEWSWLKDFFYENILKTMSEQERLSLSLAPPPSSALQLTRAFLSHSVSQPAPVRNSRPQPICLAGPFLPEPETRKEETEGPTEHLYNRNVLWTFEDIHMLIGSDLPIFGDKDRPCVSLRLRDAREPINVLTGIDFWLDNLMCNVPEVLMCYHLDGIVQKYEPMKTEDLPNMENSKFSPKVIRNVAQNILSFLKSNATKAGHTYWLFKGPHDDVVKLYDLTSLCPDSCDNPFTTPVAMLLYRVARNMRLTNRTRHVRQLLEHVIQLVAESRYPQIVASSHYMLSDLCVPARTDPAAPDFAEESEDSDDENDYQDENDPSCETDVSSHTSERDINIPGTSRQNSTDGQDNDSARRKKDKKKDIQENDRAEKGKENDARRRNRLDSGRSEKNQENERQNERKEKKHDKQENVKRKNKGGRKDKQDDTHDKNDIKEDKQDDKKSGTKEKNQDTDRREDKENDKEERRDGEENEGQEEDANALAVQIRGLDLNNIGDRVRDTGTGRARRSRAGPAPGASPPERCGRALQHALRGLRALHYVTIDKCKEEERERLKQQIIVEEQHPKMANPTEPIKMEYEPLDKKDGKEHVSRSRRRRKRNSEKSQNYLVENPSNIDKNAILVRKENKPYPTWQEPNRDDNFAWKLHLKTLLYEKICLVYATLAEYSYANEQFGFSLKYIELASKCQRLLSNMIIKSRVVDASCLIGRVGDNYFQLSKHWHRIEQFRKQFTTEHETDAQIRAEIERDLAEETDSQTDDFHLDVSVPENEVSAMLLSCSHYHRAADAALERRTELQRRLASVNNELAVRYMIDAQQIYAKYAEEDPKTPSARDLHSQFADLSRRSLRCLETAAAIFRQVRDAPNLALLLCNKGRYMRFRAHCSQGDFTSSEKRALYSSAEELYMSALKLLGHREACSASVWDLVSWELSCHLYTKAVLMQDCPGVFVNEVTEVAEAFKHALKYCQLSAGPRQYLYQFRAAMIYHRLGSLYHSQYRITQEDGPKRRILLNATRTNYEQAANMFASLEDSVMYLTAQLEHVASLETQAAVSPNVKLKSLQNAIQILRQCQSIMLLIKSRDPEDQKDQPKSDDTDEKNLKNEHSLLSLYENRLHHILKSIIQYCRSKNNKDYEKISEMYKNLYCASLKIKKNDDVREYACSICDALNAMDVVSREYE